MSPAVESWDQYEKRLHEAFHRNGFDKHCAWSGVREVTEEEIRAFRAVLESAPDEKPMQDYLAEHPSLLAGEIGPQCRWIIPHPRLGGNYIPDFMVARLDSGGVKWTLIELETPVIPSLFTKDGLPRRQLAHGVKQLDDWRAWIEENLEPARRARSRGGPGLVDVYPQAPGVVVIGRADDRVDLDRHGRLRRFEQERTIQVWSYDRLIREAEKRLDQLNNGGTNTCEECGIA